MNKQQIKKWSLLRHLNFKGYKRTASGNPLNMVKVMSPSQLTIYGNAVQSNLPSGYTEVGYIESSGTQYIDTGICPTNNTKVEVVFSADKDSVFVYGSRTSMSDGDAHGFYVAGQAYFMFGTHITNTASAKVTQQVKYTVSISQDGGYLDGALKQSYDTMSFESVLPMYLCAMSNNGNVDSRMFDGKIYSFRVWESGELIQSLVPCKRDSDGAIGMYDTVTGAFLTNSGTGVFAAGAAVTPSPDAPVEVQLCGDKTGNLFDNSSLVIGRSFSGGGVGNTWSYNSLAIKMSTDKIYIKPSTSYSIITYNNDVYWRDRIIEADTNDICTVNHAQYTVDNSYDQSKNIKIYNFTTKSNTDYIVVRFQRVDGADITSSDVNELKCMLVEGSYTADTLPAYEPYGYKVSGRVEGLNLFTSDESKWQIQTYKYFKIPVDGTTTLQMKLKPGKSIPSTLYVGYTITGYASDTGVIWLIANGAYNNSGVNMMSNSNGYISMYPPYLFDEMLDAFDIMLVQGSYTAETMPPYEPYQPPQDFAVYLPEQIAKAGDVADEVVVDMEKKTAELRKNVGSMTMSDSYSGATSITDELVRFYHSTTPQRRTSPSANIIDVMSDIYEADTWNNIGTGSVDKQFVIAGNVNTQVVNVRVPKSVIGGETNELMNTWAANHPATVYYVLDTPVTTDITSLQQWDAMPNIEGTVSITFDSAIPISSAETEYYSKEYDAI